LGETLDEHDREARVAQRGRRLQLQPHSLAVARATAQAVEASVRLEMQEHDLRACACYGDQVAVAPDSRALVTPNGRADHRGPGDLASEGHAGDPARRRSL
jgi:hypothetical protein